MITWFLDQVNKNFWKKSDIILRDYNNPGDKMENYRLAQTLPLWDWWQERNCGLLENEKFLQVENLRGETWKSQRIPLPVCFLYAHKPMVRTCEFIVFHGLITWSPRRAAAPGQGEDSQSQCKLFSSNHSNDTEICVEQWSVRFTEFFQYWLYLVSCPQA